jgi:hypothetical protein
MNELTPAAPWSAVLQTVTEARASFQSTLSPEEWATLPPEPANRDLASLPQTALSTAQVEQAELDFELLAAAEALEHLAQQIELVIAQRMEEAYAQALHVYYVTEELSLDPAHQELLPHVAAMRAAHEEQYGYPIPPRQEQ